jgi:hypothetical protein
MALPPFPLLYYGMTVRKLGRVCAALPDGYSLVGGSMKRGELLFFNFFVDPAKRVKETSASSWT